MKRSDFFIRLTTGVIFLAVACYIGVYLYNMFVNTYETTRAVSYTIEETLPTQGYIIRTETVLSEEGIAVLPIIGEGEKVASGQAIAVEYMNLGALETASEIRALRLRIAQAESARGPNDVTSLNTVLELSTAVNTNNLRRLDELALNVETNIFAVETDISMLQNRLDELESKNIGARTINATMSGTFSHVVDGFEHIDPGMLFGLLPSELEEHFNNPGSAMGTGKIITDFKWYYAAVMSIEDASLLTVGQRKTVQFFGNYNEEIQMSVESIGRREAGLCVVIFSSDRGVHNIAPLRALRADIVYDTISGIRVPKQAIHLDDDGNTFVYLQTSGFAEKVSVEILRSSGDSYLVRDGAETASPLRVDSVIIVKANNLYHGKVVA